jgi:hypothetical protein
MVQNILSSMDGDQVNNYYDTTESLQVASIIETCYNDLVSNLDLPEHMSLFELEPSLDVSLPIIMYVPSDVLSVEWIKYNASLTTDTEILYQDVTPLTLNEFVDRTYSFGSDSDTVDVSTITVGSDTFTVKYDTDRAPSYYTSIDDNTLLFDAYNNNEDTTLVSNKTMCFGKRLPTFTLSNNFVPDLDPQQFSLLYNEAKAQCFLELKQVQNISAERKARKGWIRSQITKEAVPLEREYDKLPNYGRRK